MPYEGEKPALPPPDESRRPATPAFQQPLNTRGRPEGSQAAAEEVRDLQAEAFALGRPEGRRNDAPTGSENHPRDKNKKRGEQERRHSPRKNKGRQHARHRRADQPREHSDDDANQDQAEKEDDGEREKPKTEATPWYKRPVQKWILIIGAIVGAVVGLIILVPIIIVALTTVSTDDAYVNGHVTLVAPRVPGQVISVLVDDNYRVKKGDLLVELDKEPYRVQLAMRRDALTAAERDLEQVKAQTRSQIADLRANVATLNRQMATAALARSDLARGEFVTPKGAMSREELDRRRQTLKVDEAAVEEALHAVYASRLGLGLLAQPSPGHNLAEAPLELLGNLPSDAGFDPTYAAAVESAASAISVEARKLEASKQLPKEAHQALERFYDQLVQKAPKPLPQEARQALEHFYDQLVEEAPAVKQAAAKVPQARDDLAQAELNLNYCDVVSDIDGQVTSRNVNPGNYVQAGQNVMAVRSLREIWIDANFKETQLAYLRIGQRVRCEVDMYGSWHEFEGRITGFEMGTGQTLALLPPQNATGNFVKIVQRLPVRIELTDYRPDTNPLFVGLSAEPYVYYKEPAQGPNAGQMLQPISDLPQLPPVPRSSLPREDQPEAVGQ